METPIKNSNKQFLETKIKNSRFNLLLVVAFTVINIILLITKSNTYFLFSAFIPYVVVDFGMIISGIYPAESLGSDFSDATFLDPSVFGVFIAIALIILVLYFISWIFSKNNKPGWLIFALVMFAIDTVGMLAFTGVATESIIDIVFHIWVIISLVQGISAACKLKKLPEEVYLPEAQLPEENFNDLLNSGIIRVANPYVKARILLQTNTLGHTFTYRRVKKVNELVIDGNVYDEFEALIETAHSLKAEIDGHQIEMGFDGVLHSYLKIDGQIVTKKLRLY